MDWNNEVILFPNPATHTFEIINNTKSVIDRIRIYNITGQVVLNKQFLTNILDVSYLQSGMYIVELVANEFVIRKKLIIE